MKKTIFTLMFLTALSLTGTRSITADGNNELFKTPYQQEERLRSSQFYLSPNLKKIHGDINSIMINQNKFGQKDWITLVASVVFGGMLGLGTVIFVEKLKQPNLIFEVGNNVDDVNNKRRFIHIKIKNKDRNIKWIPLATNIASSARVILKIDRNIFTGRWTSKGEPLVYGSGGIPISVNPNEILVVPREDICPSNDDSEAVEVAIGLKYENETNFYGFNNESYLYQPMLKNTKLSFGSGNHAGEIIVITMGKKYSHKFIVHNPSVKTSNFSLNLT